MKYQNDNSWTLVLMIMKKAAATLLRITIFTVHTIRRGSNGERAEETDYQII